MDYSAYHWSEKARKQAERAKEIVDSIGSVLHYKGSVATRADLPITGQVLGDMYNITSDGSNVVWNGSDWDDISGIVDLSAYRTASDQDTIDAGKVPTSRTVNGKALGSNISLTASDVGALPNDTTIGNATLTIQKNGTTVDTFTANATSNKTINIIVPTKTSDLTNDDGFITGINSSDIITALGYTPVNPTALATVATSGSYNDLSNKPTIPAAQVNSDWNANSGVAQILNKPTLATVATSGAYSDLSGKPTIPTVNNPTITLTQGGTTKGSFTLNQSSGATIALDAGGGSPLPSQTGNAGKFLTTDGTDASWGVPKTHDLFDNKWTDHLLNDESWLRADTFSWQDGTVYSDAYNHLVVDLGTITTETLYGFIDRFGDILYTKSSQPSVGDVIYDSSGNTTLYTVESSEGYTGGWIINGSWTRTDGDTSNDITIQSDTTSSGAIRQTETIGSYTITYWLATDGHKICTPDQETTAANIYTESGVAWYYILDTANQRFKLPRELPITDKSRGNGMTLGLTDGANNGGLWTTSTGDIAANGSIYGTTVGTGVSGSNVFGNGKALGITTDPTKSCIISHRANENGQQYLYFYVGQFSQSATEQTAGLNSELFNGKMDRDMSNMNASQTAKDIVMGWGMPDYSAVITGISFPYTAPSNGIISFNIDAYNLYLTINSTQINVGGNDSANEGPVQLPLSKGDIIQSSATNYYNLIFIPLKGV